MKNDEIHSVVKAFQYSKLLSKNFKVNNCIKTIIAPQWLMINYMLMVCLFILESTLNYFSVENKFP